MRGRLAVLALAVLLVATVPLAPRAVAQVGTSSLSGTVCAAEGGPSPYADGGADMPSKSSCGGALPNATVRLVRAGPLGNGVAGVDQTVTADADGHFAFKNLADGTYQLTTTRAGFAGLNETVDVSGDTSHDVQLAAARFAQPGRVVGPKGQGIAGASVSICCMPYDPAAPDGNPSTTTANDGAFTLQAMGGYRSISVTGASGYQDASEYRLIDGTSVTLALTPLPPPDAYIVGHVRDQDGNPVVGVRVLANAYGGCCIAYATAAGSSGGSTGAPEPASMPARPSYVGGTNSTLTQADGAYRIGVYSGSVGLSINQDGYAPYSTSLQVDSGATVTQEVKLLKYPPKTAHVTGQVTDAATGKGLRAVSLSVRASEYGLYECSDNGLQPTPVPVPMGVAQSGGGEASAGTVTADPGGTSSAPTSGPATQAGSAQPSTPTYSSVRGGSNGCAITIGDDGSFDGDVTPGYSVVDVYYQTWLTCTETRDADGATTSKCGPDYFAWSGTFDLKPGDNTIDVALVQRPGPDAVLSGYVVDGATGKAIPRATVNLWNQDNGASGQAMTDQDGSYRVRLRSGFHQVTVSVYGDNGRPGGYLTWQGVLDVPAGETPFDITLTPGQEANGCCCCMVPMKEGMGVPATAPTPSDASGGFQHGSSTAAPSAPGGGNAAAGATSTAPAIQDLGGGLGPYDAAARAKAIQAGTSAATKSSPAAGIALVGVLLLAAFVGMRRRPD